MKTFSYNGSAGQLTEVLDCVETYCEELVITHVGHESIVVLPLSEYESLRETMYLMNSLANARRLMDLIAHLEQHIHKTRAVSLSEGI
ncbi:prevent-host-death family protein [Rothia dentocariosa ATCC 17931]|uniref:Antitoxin n=1 Tax=Rothia dentocariosa (strain ATCC 17931 / CDC X599 / XDIA) TaxID=762948 RepID=E3H163_ROTDC|nr:MULTISPECIES: type II toxin-antitoxin system prevent-host-death family antitoxin [Rothia]ADP41151.1 prevent-host-death family protein [Rothia dentocariosa ATCC 17931]OFN45741.1 prevent-host-death protein [Rothia sp. HMSC071F11]WMS31898.1 type II toxin-antitoxin system prevent-host-death family antitoxin [Rothia dentocariosa]SUE39309.1 Antitoxin YefM [Rothia dentocariosa]